MRNSNISTSHHMYIRNFLNDFRRQSSVNEYKLPNALVCFTKNNAKISLPHIRNIERLGKKL